MCDFSCLRIRFTPYVIVCLLAYMTTQPGHFLSSSLLSPESMNCVTLEGGSFFTVYDIPNPKNKKKLPIWRARLPNHATPHLVRYVFNNSKKYNMHIRSMRHSAMNSKPPKHYVHEIHHHHRSHHLFSAAPFFFFVFLSTNPFH